MDMKEKVIGAVSLTALVGMGMLMGWGLLTTEHWWLAFVLLISAPITFLIITRDN